MRSALAILVGVLDPLARHRASPFTQYYPAPMKNETLAQFCDRLTSAAAAFTEQTGARFHLLRAAPADDVFAREAPFRLQAILSGVVDRKEGPLLSCGFVVPGARPYFHPHLCMAFDGLDAVEAKFTSVNPVDRAQALFQFGTFDVNPEAVLLHADRGLPYLNRVRMLSPLDPALVEAQVIAYGLMKSCIGGLARELTDASPVARESLFDRQIPLTLGEMANVARFVEVVEARMHVSRPGQKLSTLIDNALVNANDRAPSRDRGIFPETAIVHLEGMAHERHRQARQLRDHARPAGGTSSALSMAM